MCNVGVRQGEDIVPVLFTYNVSDIEELLTKAGCNDLNFSDDLVNSYLKLFVLMYADTPLCCVVMKGK